MKLKFTIAFLSAILFNIAGASVIADAGALPFAGVFGCTSLLSLFGGAASGSLNMGLQIEIWHNTIVGNLFADNSFLSKAFNADDYVNGKKVHIPNAGRPSRTEKNRQQVPATAKQRTDRDVEYDMNEFTTDPIYISNAEDVELSYNKRESVIGEDRAVLHETIANDILLSWSPKKDSKNIIKTSGSAAPAHLKGATGFRKGLSIDDVSKVMVQFNDQNIPQEGRYALLDAHMYAQLLNGMTEHEATAFHAAADVKNGIIGKLLTFNFMMRSKSLIYKADGTPIEWQAGDEDEPQTFAATDNAGALFWHERHVCRSVGEVKMFGSEDNPLYYGDIYSFLLRAGGTIMRSNGRGVAAIVQDKADEGYVSPRQLSTTNININTGEAIEALVTATDNLTAATQALVNKQA